MSSSKTHLNVRYSYCIPPKDREALRSLTPETKEYIYTAFRSFLLGGTIPEEADSIYHLLRIDLGKED